MAAQVLTFASQERVDAAWHDYADTAKQLHADPHLLSDRSFNEALARKHERWRRLFLAMDS